MTERLLSTGWYEYTMRPGATLRKSDDRCPAITVSGDGAFPLTGGRGSPSKDSPKALCCCRACHSGLIPALCLPAKGLWAATCLSQVMSQGKNVVVGASEGNSWRGASFLPQAGSGLLEKI